MTSLESEPSGGLSSPRPVDPSAPDLVPLSPAKIRIAVSCLNGDAMHLESGGEAPSGFSAVEEEERRERPTGPGVFGMIMICTNSMLGIGILGVANAFANTGIVISLFIMYGMAVLSLVSTWMILSLSASSGLEELPALYGLVLGRCCENVFSVLILLIVTGSLVSYLIVAGDMLVSWLALGGIEMDSRIKRGVLVGVYSVIIPIGLSLSRKTCFVAWISIVNGVCICIYAVVMIYEGITMGMEKGISATVSSNEMSINMFSSIAMFGMSFGLPSCILTTMRGYDAQTHNRKIVTGVAIGIAVLFMTISGLTGYLMFGASAEADVLKNFEGQDGLILVVRAGCFIVVSCAYPMALRTIEESWSAMLCCNKEPAELPCLRRALVFFLSNLIPVAMAIFVPTVKPVFEIGGALGGCLVGFSFPAILWVRQSGRGLTHWKNILAIILAIFGVACAVVSTTLAIQSAIEGFK